MTRYFFKRIIFATLILICTGPALAANCSSNNRSKDCQTGKKILFVSSGVLDADILLRASAPDVLALRFDPRTASLSDLLGSARKALNGAKADSIGFAVHDYGSNKFYLTGSQTISLGSTLASAEQRAFWRKLGEMIGEQGRIDILACNLAAGQNGKLLMAALKGASGREVAASTDKTGNPAQGGNWFLETGGFDVAGVYFDARGLEDYTGLLLSQEQELTASGGVATDQFGFSVSLSGDGARALIGAKGVNSNQGVAYVFDLSSGTQTKLTASDGAASDFFGCSVSLSDDGTRALIGAYYKKIGGNDHQGAAYVFDYSGSPSSWTQSEKLTGSDGAASDYFGLSVSLSDDGARALIGAYRKNTYKGAAYVFDYSGSPSSWTQRKELTAIDGAASNYFGCSVSLSGDGTRALIGAYGKDSRKGAAYVFDYSDLSWSESEKLTATDGAENDYFGLSVSLSDDGARALIGAYGKDSQKGAAYVFFSPTIYESVKNGNWSEKTTWNQSTDGGVTWTAARAAPDDTSAGTTIKTGHTVTVDAATSTDQTTVEAEAVLSIAFDQTLTIANGEGPDLTVQGTLTNAGKLTCADGTEVLFSGASDFPISGAGTWTFKTLTLEKDAAATRLDINTGSDVTVETALTVTRGTLDLSGWTYNLLLGGSLSIAENGRWAKHGDSTYYLKFYDTDCTFTDSSTGGPQNLGHVKVD